MSSDAAGGRKPLILSLSELDFTDFRAHKRLGCLLAGLAGQQCAILDIGFCLGNDFAAHQRNFSQCFLQGGLFGT